MKKLSITALAALSLISGSALADDDTATKPAATQANGGTVHFKGEVVNAACAVDANSMDQTVELGQVRTEMLSAADKTSNAVGFNIQLDGCNTKVATKASIAFIGTTIDSAHSNVLALQDSAAGNATNVGIQILDRTGNPVDLDGTSYTAETTLIDGVNVLPFQARYFAIDQATAGTANADATFKVQYQ